MLTSVVACQCRCSSAGAVVRTVGPGPEPQALTRHIFAQSQTKCSHLDMRMCSVMAALQTCSIKSVRRCVCASLSQTASVHHHMSIISANEFASHSKIRPIPALGTGFGRTGAQSSSRFARNQRHAHRKNNPWGSGILADSAG